MRSWGDTWGQGRSGQEWLRLGVHTDLPLWEQGPGGVGRGTVCGWLESRQTWGGSLMGEQWETLFCGFRIDQDRSSRGFPVAQW